MSNYSKRKLVEYSAKLAKEKHPKGYNRKQLIQASKELFGGHAANPFKKIESEIDIHHKRNSMSLIDGHYSLSMTGCEVVGINGDCGFRCPVFLAGDCKEIGDWTKKDIIESDELDEQEKHDMLEIYFD